MDSDTRIVTVEAWACSLPLSEPLSFGAFEVREREYACVRMRTHGGLVADALALSRRAPVDVAVLDVLAPLLVGRDGTEVEERLEEVKRATRALDRDGVMARARSLVELCLQDLRAQVVRLPLWKSLGGFGEPQPLPVLLVEGYPLAGESDEAFAGRLAERVDAGYGALKIEAASYAADPERLSRRLRLLRELVGERPEIVIDMAWAWESAEEALAPVASWQQARLAWLEDPFPVEAVAELATLKARAPGPLGAGDEVTRPSDLERLLACGHLDVLRLDATALGGAAAAIDFAERARIAGVRPSFHVHPEVHLHCAFAAGVDHVEAFSPDRPFDCSHELLEEPPMSNMRDGRLAVPSAAGSSVRLVLDVVEATAYRRGEARDQRLASTAEVSP